MEQRSIGQGVTLEGVGLHSGRQSRVEIHPAPAGTGIVFERMGAPDCPPLPATVRHVVDTQLATTLGHGDWRLRTTEHFLAATLGLGVDNLRVVVDGDELPVLDGSAAQWVGALRRGGIVGLGAPRTPIAPDAPLHIEDGDRWARVRPAPRLSIEVHIEFEAPVGVQSLVFCADAERFVSELSWARTFGFARHVPAMRRMGLVAGGSLDNAVVFEDGKVLNPGGLKAPDEPVRHKMLDVLGDLALLGRPLVAHIEIHKPGHGLTVALVRALDSRLVQGQS